MMNAAEFQWVAKLGVVMLAVGCSRENTTPPPQPAPPPTSPPMYASATPPASADEPAAKPPPQNPQDASPQSGTRVTYQMRVPFGPCNKVLNTYIKFDTGYQHGVQCKDPEGSESVRPSTEDEFNRVVYIKTRLASGEGYTPIKTSEVKSAPDGTTKCYRSRNKANTVCQNANGIVTFSSFEGQKLKPPKRDANRSQVLVSIEER